MGSLIFANRQLSLDVQTENAAIARRLYTIIKSYIHIMLELLVRKKMRLKKNNVYICRIREGARELLTDFEIVSDDFQFNHIDFKVDYCKRMIRNVHIYVVHF